MGEWRSQRRPITGRPRAFWHVLLRRRRQMAGGGAIDRSLRHAAQALGIDDQRFRRNGIAPWPDAAQTNAGVCAKTARRLVVRCWKAATPACRQCWIWTKRRAMRITSRGRPLLNWVASPSRRQRRALTTPVAHPRPPGVGDEMVRCWRAGAWREQLSAANKTLLASLRGLAVLLVLLSRAPGQTAARAFFAALIPAKHRPARAGAGWRGPQSAWVSRALGGSLPAGVWLARARGWFLLSSAVSSGTAVINLPSASNFSDMADQVENAEIRLGVAAGGRCHCQPPLLAARSKIQQQPGKCARPSANQSAGLSPKAGDNHAQPVVHIAGLRQLAHGGIHNR